MGQRLRQVQLFKRGSFGKCDILLTVEDETGFQVFHKVVVDDTYVEEPAVVKYAEEPDVTAPLLLVSFAETVVTYTFQVNLVLFTLPGNGPGYLSSLLQVYKVYLTQTLKKFLVPLLF